MAKSKCPLVGKLKGIAKKIKNGEIKRTMFLAKGSLFLGRMTQLSDGASFMLEKNNGGK